MCTNCPIYYAENAHMYNEYWPSPAIPKLLTDLFSAESKFLFNLLCLQVAIASLTQFKKFADKISSASLRAGGAICLSGEISPAIML